MKKLILAPFAVLATAVLIMFLAFLTMLMAWYVVIVWQALEDAL